MSPMYKVEQVLKNMVADNCSGCRSKTDAALMLAELAEIRAAAEPFSEPSANLHEPSVMRLREALGKPVPPSAGSKAV